MTKKTLPRQRLIGEHPSPLQEGVGSLHCGRVDHRNQEIVNFIQFFTIVFLVLFGGGSWLVVIMKLKELRRRRMREKLALVYILEQFTGRLIDFIARIGFPSDVDSDVGSSDLKPGFTLIAVPKLREEVRQLDIFRGLLEGPRRAGGGGRGEEEEEEEGLEAEE